MGKVVKMLLGLYAKQYLDYYNNKESVTKKRFL